MSDLEALTKTLIQVVGSLQELISKKPATQPSLQPQPKLKKTSDMTYNQFISQALATKKPVEVASKKASFHLQEDMQLLYDLSQHTPITAKTYDAIAGEKKLQRTADALKNRYNDVLIKIDENEMKKIVKWIEDEGLEGYLFVEDEEVKIQHRDPKQSDKKRSRPANVEAEIKRAGKGSKLKNVPKNCKQLSEVLKLYSKMVNVPLKTLVEKLDQVSGDLVQLDNYIETKDSRLLWTPEDDEILKKGSAAEIEVLKRYRGAGIDTRRKYLGL